MIYKYKIKARESITICKKIFKIFEKHIKKMSKGFKN